MNISFKGYDNVCAGEAQLLNGYIRIISARLNNEGVPDLDNFRNFVKTHDINPHIIDGDIITFFHTRSDDSTAFNLGLQTFHDAYTLKEIQTKCVPEEISDANFSKLEKLHLSFYTMLSDFTRRMSNDNGSMLYEKNIRDAVKAKIHNTFLTLSGNEPFTCQLMTIFNDENASKMHFQEIAGKMNKFIQKSFIHYFK